jgi:hypothetical protein
MTDNDRELLALAAKACSLDMADKDIRRRWNPLHNDGDALRLMVALQISVTPCFGSTYIDAGGRLDFSHIHSENETAISGARRAIVMMAAEIGRGMR